jgi:hypothetical protein
MITIMAITLVMVGIYLISRNFMPDREERFYPTAWNLRWNIRQWCPTKMSACSTPIPSSRAAP